MDSSTISLPFASISPHSAARPAELPTSVPRQQAPRCVTGTADNVVITTPLCLQWSASSYSPLFLLDKNPFKIGKLMATCPTDMSRNLSRLCSKPPLLVITLMKLSDGRDFENVILTALTDLKFTFYGVFLEPSLKQHITSSHGCH